MARRRRDRRDNRKGLDDARIKESLEVWKPRTELGRKVKKGDITDIQTVLNMGKRILEVEVIDSLIKNLDSEMIMMGQAKGKFGGGQRRVFKQTQKKTAEGNKPKFSILIAVGNKDGIVGVGIGKARETVPAREKAFRNSKLRVFKIRRGCGSWACGCREPHSIPFTVYGKCGSVEIWLMPAPKGSGLKVQSEVRKVLELAGIKDIWSKTLGHTKTTINLLQATEIALRQLMATKVPESARESLGIREGMVKEVKNV